MTRILFPEHRVSWPGLRTALRVAQLTDVHVGPTTPFSLLRRAVTEASKRSDLLVYTGDTVNIRAGGARRFAELLRSVPQPVVAVLGNHDHMAGASQVRAFLEDAGIVVLQNECTEHDGLWVVGVDDGHTHHADPVRAFEKVPTGERANALVLSHFPPAADQIAPLGGRLILSGHTHGGQVRLPGGVAPILQLLGRSPYVYGWYTVAGADLYVSAGLGHSWLRIASPPEVPIFHLEPA